MIESFEVSGAEILNKLNKAIEKTTQDCRALSQSILEEFERLSHSDSPKV